MELIKQEDKNYWSVVAGGCMKEAARIVQSGAPLNVDKRIDIRELVDISVKISEHLLEWEKLNNQNVCPTMSINTSDIVKEAEVGEIVKKYNQILHDSDNLGGMI